MAKRHSAKRSRKISGKHRVVRHRKAHRKAKRKSPPAKIPSLLKMESSLESSFAKRFLALERAMGARLLAVEKSLLHATGGLRMHDSPAATKLSFALPGFSKKDVSIEITDHTATVSAQAKGSSYFKSVSLPFVILPAKAKASFKGGELSLVLPKLKFRMPRHESRRKIRA